MRKEFAEIKNLISSKDDFSLVAKILSLVEDGKRYIGLPLYKKTIAKDSKFFERYAHKFPLFVVASIKIKDKYLVIKNQNREGLEFVGGKAEELNFRKALIREVSEEVGLDISNEKIVPKALLLNKFSTPLGSFWHFGVGFSVEVSTVPLLRPLPSEVKQILLVEKENLSHLSFANHFLL